jgi:uroporphyrinogen-III decarboxylase
MEKSWADLTPEEKRQQRIEKVLSAKEINFSSAWAEQAYKKRVKRLVDAYQVREPDRVPVSVSAGSIPLYWAGTNYYTAMYDYKKAAEACEKFNRDFDIDTFASPAMIIPARVYEILDPRSSAWPGHGLPVTATRTQYVEGEYMKSDEYDALIRDPSDFYIRRLLPRVFGALAPFSALTPLSSITMPMTMYFAPCANPEIQALLQKLIDAGKELSEWIRITSDFSQKAMESGLPSIMRGSMATAPFDALGDTLRGTRGIMMDMYRQPDKLLEALDVITDLMINTTIADAYASKCLTTSFPLHKGADGFMSDKQFRTFYWPSLKKVIQALIAEGLIVYLFAEGSYNTRLDLVNEFPKGTVVWLFDQTDMARAKKILGDKCCISGNVPSSMLCTATPGEVKEYSRKLIEICGKGGGYILAGGAVDVDNANPDNLRAMIEAAKEYGVYR